jgi:anaerobic selenocysteine-containing dehydrogenase
MNHRDALTEGIEDGDTVRIWNDRGKCMLKVSVGEQVLPGVMVTQGLWADSTDSTIPQATKQLVNSLTPDRIADMGGGATFFSGRVSVQKI